MATDQLVLTGFVPPVKEKFYQHLPFNLPASVCRLDVRYVYSRAIGSDPHLTGGNTVDIGIFDQRGIDFPGGGYRGWSGSARDEFFITPTDATPGYLPGPLGEGVWHICLGFYKVAPEGCHYTVAIGFTSDDTPITSSPEFPPLLALSSTETPIIPHPDGWYRGELHCHTHHSDGDASPEEVLRLAQSLGLDFLAITDHNGLSHLADVASLNPHGLILIPGTEVTTYKGHWNVWGLDEWIDFRIQTPADMAQVVNYALAQGYLTSCNHPRPYGPPWEYEAVLPHHCIEVWNGPWRLMNQVALEFWETRLRAGRRLVAVGGSDSHFLHREHHARLGTPTTWIHCTGTPTPAVLLAGLRAGHAFISDAPDGPYIYLSSGAAMIGDVVSCPANGELTVQVRVVGRGTYAGVVRDGWLSTVAACRFSVQDIVITLSVATTPYVRAQLIEASSDSQTVRALTNPIYLE